MVVSRLCLLFSSFIRLWHLVGLGVARYLIGAVFALTAQLRCQDPASTPATAVIGQQSRTFIRSKPSFTGAKQSVEQRTGAAVDVEHRG